MPRRRKPPNPPVPQEPSRYEQLSILDAIAKVEQLKTDTQADVDALKRDGRYDKFFDDLLGGYRD